MRGVCVFGGGDREVESGVDKTKCAREEGAG